jgi:hypothetical protein
MPAPLPSRAVTTNLTLRPTRRLPRIFSLALGFFVSMFSWRSGPVVVWPRLSVAATAQVCLPFFSFGAVKLVSVVVPTTAPSTSTW